MLKLSLTLRTVDTRQVAADWAADARTLVPYSQVKISLNGEWVFPGMRPLSGTLPLQLLITVDRSCRLHN